MGWKSTLDVSCKEALDTIYQTLEEGVSDEILAKVLEEVLGGYEHGHNYTIIKDK